MTLFLVVYIRRDINSTYNTFLHDLHYVLCWKIFSFTFILVKFVLSVSLWVFIAYM